jgi:hypothetical protein
MLAEALDDPLERGSRAQVHEGNQAALGTGIRLRKHIHAPQSAQQDQGSAPRADAWKLHEPRKRHGRG